MAVRLDEQGYNDALKAIEDIKTEIARHKEAIKALNKDKKKLENKIDWYEKTKGRELRSGENTKCYRVTGKRYSDLTEEQQKFYRSFIRRKGFNEDDYKN